jgi:hypothetical protein
MKRILFLFHDEDDLNVRVYFIDRDRYTDRPKDATKFKSEEDARHHLRINFPSNRELIVVDEEEVPMYIERAMVNRIIKS